ncbi:MAG: EamA family transporter [Gammaproteobacteria bacterium]|nr:EamA family transporter [Gammaproteobacteria bacterium]
MNLTKDRYAVGITMLGTFCFVVQDSTIKWLTDDVAILQIVFLRSLFALLFLVMGAVAVRNALTLKSDRPWLLFIRTLTNIASWCCFFTGLKYLPLATAATLFFSFPIYVTALSIPFLGEKVGIRRWSAMLVGFMGVLLMTRPGAAFQWSALLMIMAAFGWATVVILTRILAQHSDHSKTRVNTPSSMLFHTLVGFCIVTAIPQPWVWQPVSAESWWLIIFAALFGVVAQLTLVKAYSMASPSLIAPFEYLGLVWAAIFGFVIWNDTPDSVMIVGATLIIASNIYIARRETTVQDSA